MVAEHTLGQAVEQPAIPRKQNVRCLPIPSQTARGHRLRCDSEIEFGVMNSLLGVPCESRTSTGTGKQIEESGSIANLARTLGSTRSECDWIRASAPVLASNSRPRARYRHPFPSYLSRAIPSPAHASSAIAWSVSSASHIRQSRPSAKSSSDIPARSQKTFHSSAEGQGMHSSDPRPIIPSAGPRSRLRGKVTRRPLHTARRGQNGRQDGGLQATKPLQLSCYGAAGSGVQLFVRRVEDNCCLALIF